MKQIAYVFPGQGSQSMGMLADLALQYPIIEQTMLQASKVLNYDLWNLIQHGPEEQLNQTEYTQVAMLVSDIAVFRCIQEVKTTNPMVVAGHSLGEYAALVAAQALNFEDAVLLVRQRGRLMQETVPMGEGAMAAIIGLDDTSVSLLCQQASDEAQQVMPANFNAIGQVVVAGHTPAVKRLIMLAEEAGARMAKEIPVSVPCHCGLLKDAAQEFSVYLNRTSFQMPIIPVISNVTAQPYQNVDDIKRLLCEQLYSPVRWVETIQWMSHQGITEIVESGPGKVLTGLIKRIDKSISTRAICDTESLHVLQQEN